MAAFRLLFVISHPAWGDEQPLPPLRIPNLAVGTRCFGLLSCTAIDPFGIRLRAAALAIFRPEKGRDRDLYAARIQIAPSVTLFEWGEIGVAIPITLFKKDIGVSAVYEPLQPFGRVRLPLGAFLRGLATTAFVRIHIAHGPFVGGLPPAPAENPATPSTPDFMAQAIQNYQAQTQFEFGLAMQKRIGPVTATGSVGASVATQRVEVYGGAELAYNFKIFNVFVQGQGIGVPKCPPEEAALNFCARGFRFGAGVRFDFDLGQGGLMIGTGSGAVEPGWMGGAQLGLDYDEHVRQMHGDGSEAAQAWWERRFEAMARGWAEWKSAAAVWDDDNEAARRVRPQLRGPFSALLGGSEPPPSSPWLDALLGEDVLPESPYVPEPVSGAPQPAPGAKPRSAQAPKAKPGPGRKQSARSLFAEANARAAARRQLAREPQFTLPSDPAFMTDAELARLQWQSVQEERLRQEQQAWRESTKLPPMEKAILNWVATAPARAVLGLLAMSGPGRRAAAEEQMRQLRPLKCTPAEEAACGAVEEMFDAMATMLAPSAAEATAARQTLAALARRGLREAGHSAETAAAEQLLRLAEETGVVAAEPSESHMARFFATVRERLNPMNYETQGLGSNFGNVTYRGPRLPTPPSTTSVAELAEAAKAEAAHGLQLSEETKQALIANATNPTEKGVSPVGRALQKHAARPSSAFSGASGNAEANTAQGGAYLRAILEDPASLVTNSSHKVFGEVIKVRLPDGTGAWFKADGEFIGFLERYTPKPD